MNVSFWCSESRIGRAPKYVSEHYEAFGQCANESAPALHILSCQGSQINKLKGEASIVLIGDFNPK